MKNKSKPIEISPIKGHIILYCKGFYKYNNFFEGLKRIWAIRCGYDYELTSKETLSYVAMEMFDILLETNTPEKIKWIMKELHRDIVSKYIGDFVETLSPIEAIIWQYKSHLAQLQIKEKDKLTGKWYSLIKLPKPKEKVFNRILKGNGKYEDYKLINS